MLNHSIRYHGHGDEAEKSMRSEKAENMQSGLGVKRHVLFEKMQKKKLIKLLVIIVFVALFAYNCNNNNL